MPFPRPPTGRLTTPAPQYDPEHTVQGVATVYHCPTLDALDAHLENLADRIRLAQKLPRLVAMYWADVDALLERRGWLMMRDEGARE